MTRVWLCTHCDWYSLFGQGDGSCHLCRAPLRESITAEEPRVKTHDELMQEYEEINELCRKLMYRRVRKALGE